MLTKILEYIRTAKGSFSVRQLSQKLDVEPSALQGMLEQLVRMEKLEIKEEQIDESSDCKTCVGCKGTADCPFIFHLPLQYQLPEKENPATV